MGFLSFYNVIILVCVLSMVTMSIHVHNNTAFSADKRKWFIATFMLVSVCAISECIGTALSDYNLGREFHYALTLIEFCMLPFIPVCMSFACEIKKPAKAIGIMGIIHMFIEIGMLFFGGIYYITPDGIYHRGSFYFIYVIMYLVAYLYNLVIVILVNRRYKSRDVGTVAAIVITVFAGLIPSIIDGSIKTAYLSVTLQIILEYMYFEGLYEQDMQRKLTAHNERMNKELIRTLSYTLEAKDVYTKGHSMRVAEYTRIIASHMNFDEESLEKLHFAATLHDIGKIGIPDTVLNKPGKLTESEFNIIKMHTTIGADILKNIETIKYASDIARYHHERYDGKGYPDGLSGESIPLEARIVAIADTYDAMTSKRIYRRKILSSDIIREEFAKNKGKQFDPELVELFLTLFDKGILKPIRSEESRNSYDSENIELIRDNLLATLQENEEIVGNNSFTIDDILKLVEKSPNDKGAFNTEYSEFKKFFKYLENISRRFDHQCFLVMVSINAENSTEITPEELDAAMEAFEISTKQTIREVDVCTRFAANKYLLILVGSGEENIKDIMERVINHYYKIQGRTNLEPLYETRKINVMKKNIETNPLKLS